MSLSALSVHPIAIQMPKSIIFPQDNITIFKI